MRKRELFKRYGYTIHGIKNLKTNIMKHTRATTLKSTFFHSYTTTEENPAGITFSDFNGTNDEVNTFGAFLIDWSYGLTGRLYAETNNGQSINIVSITDIPSSELTEWSRLFIGIVTPRPFTSKTIYTTTSGDWILFDLVSYGINGVMGPMTSSRDFATEEYPSMIVLLPTIQ